MPCGLFGKLPVKRDFVAINLPREFLTLWENWLQPSIAASRERLGRDWQDMFLTAPIWRFWLGQDLSGTTVTGAIMPSVDGIGRYFPLTICAWPEGSARYSPPVRDQSDDWYGSVETALLRALNPAFDGEPSALLEGLHPPPEEKLDVLDGLFVRDLQSVLGNRSYWWSHGGAGRPVQMVAFDRMPDAYRFAGFITGEFDRVDG